MPDWVVALIVGVIGGVAGTLLRLQHDRPVLPRRRTDVVTPANAPRVAARTA
jgi:hypothetical protein